MTTTTPPATLVPTNPPPKDKLVDEKKQPMILGPGGAVQLTTMAEALRYAQAFVDSGLAPKGDTPQAVLIKMQAGAELGFKPARALASLVVVNGRLTMQGDAMLALIRASGKGRVIVGIEGAGDSRAGFADIERFDTHEKDRITFSWADAKRAGLAGKDTYKNYGDDMLIWKAVARAGRRYFSDVLAGMESEEEARTYEPTPYVPVTVQPSNARQLAAPPSDPDPLMEVTPESAETVAPEAMHGALHEPGCAKRETDGACDCRLKEPCPHPGLTAGYLDNMPADEEVACQACGEVIRGPGKNVKVKAPKGQGRIA